MGIRVHKVIGYGTDKLKRKDYRFEDDRFDGEAMMNGWTDISKENLLANEEAVRDAIVEEYGGKHHEGFDFKWVLGEIRDNPKDKVEVRMEFEGSDIPAMVIVPLGCKDWIRYDDIIDYYEEKGEGRFTYLNRPGIWPYDCGVRRFRGRRMFEFEPKILGGGEYNRMVGRWDDKLEPIMKDEALTDLLENWRPVLPRSIVAWIQLQDWITDKKGFADMLRPCIYVYWS